MRGALRRRGGVTLLEVIGVLLLSTLIIALAIGLLGRLSYHQRVAQAVDGVHLVSHQMQRLHWRAPYHDGGAAAVNLGSRVVTAGILPNGFAAVETTTPGEYEIRHPLSTSSGSGSTFFVEGTSIAGAGGNYEVMEIRLEDLTPEACLYVATLSFPSSARLIRVLVADAGGGLAPSADILTPFGREVFPSGQSNSASNPAARGVALGDIASVCESGTQLGVSWQFLGSRPPT
ncbi:MAG: hypothetical protein OD811_01855 [Alphaproteobacteria bacterium]